MLLQCGFLLAGVACFAISLDAQSPAVPDLTETWARKGCVPASDVCPKITTDRPFRARAKALRDAFDEIAAPKYYCAQAGLPQLLVDPYDFKMEQKADRVVLTYEQQDVVRTIWLEGHGHARPTVYDFYTHGYSIGRYEGNALVIETTKFTFDPSGLNEQNMPSSTQKRVVERYWREGDRLRVDVTTEDPIFLLEPIRFSYEWERTDKPLTLPYACDPELARPPLDQIPSKYEDH
jgi:hypothetical protein